MSAALDLKAKLRAAQAERAQNRPAPKLSRWLTNGELQCVLCQAHVRNEALWPSHTRTPAHQKAVLDWQRKIAVRKAEEAAAGAASPAADGGGGKRTEVAPEGDGPKVGGASANGTAGGTSGAGSGPGAGSSSGGSSALPGVKPASQLRKEAEAAKEAKTAFDYSDSEDGSDDEISVKPVVGSSSATGSAHATTPDDKASLIGSQVLARLQFDAAQEEQEDEEEEDEENPFSISTKRRKVIGPVLAENFDLHDITAEEVEILMGAPAAGGDAASSSGSGAGGASSSLLSAGGGGGTTGAQEQAPNDNVPAGFFDDADEEANAKGVIPPSKRKELEKERSMKAFELRMEKEYRELAERRNEVRAVARKNQRKRRQVVH